MSGKYILAGKTPVPCSDLMRWGEWMEKNSRQVALSHLSTCRVSTVFLGLDHAFGGGPPILFETMVFGTIENHELDEYCVRYSTWEEAEEGHKRIVESARQIDRMINVEAEQTSQDILKDLGLLGPTTSPDGKRALLVGVRTVHLIGSLAMSQRPIRSERGKLSGNISHS